MSSGIVGSTVRPGQFFSMPGPTVMFLTKYANNRDYIDYTFQDLCSNIDNVPNNELVNSVAFQEFSKAYDEYYKDYEFVVGYNLKNDVTLSESYVAAATKSVINLNGHDITIDTPEFNNPQNIFVVDSDDTVFCLMDSSSDLNRYYYYTTDSDGIDR